MFVVKPASSAAAHIDSFMSQLFKMKHTSETRGSLLLRKADPRTGRTAKVAPNLQVEGRTQQALTHAWFGEMLVGVRRAPPSVLPKSRQGSRSHVARNRFAARASLHRFDGLQKSEFTHTIRK